MRPCDSSVDQAALNGRIVVVGSIHATAGLRLFDDLQQGIPGLE